MSSQDSDNILTDAFRDDLLKAARYADVVKLENLLSNFDKEFKTILDCTDQEGKSLLHLICNAGNPEEAQACYSKLINWLINNIQKNLLYKYLNEQDNDGETALHIAINNSCPEIAEDLIYNGACVTIISKKQKSQIDLLSPYSIKCIVNNMNKNVNYIGQSDSKYCKTCRDSAQKVYSTDLGKSDVKSKNDELLNKYTFCLHFGSFVPYANDDVEDQKMCPLNCVDSDIVMNPLVNGDEEMSPVNSDGGRSPSISNDGGMSPMFNPPKLNFLTVSKPLIQKKHSMNRVMTIKLNSEKGSESASENKTKVYEKEEMAMIYNFNSKLDQLANKVLVHPLLATFLHLKWERLKHFVLFIMLYYLVWVMMYIAFTTSIFYLKYVYTSVGVGNTTNATYTTNTNTTLKCRDNDVSKKIQTVLEILKAIRLLSCIFPLCIETVQLFNTKLAYFKDSKNIAQLYLISLAILDYFYKNRMLHAAAILCCIFLLLSHLDEFPNAISAGDSDISVVMKRVLTWATVRYFQIFRNVMKKVAWLLIPFFAVMFGFLITFAIIFRGSGSFDITFTSFVQLLALAVGHRGYEDVFTKNYSCTIATKKHQESLAHGVYAVFLITIVFVWSNFLIGITLENFTKVRKEAEINSISYRIEMMYVMERLLNSIHSIFPSIMNDSYDKVFIFNRKECESSDYKLDRDSHSVHVNKNDLPRELVQELRRIIKERNDNNRK